MAISGLEGIDWSNIEATHESFEAAAEHHRQHFVKTIVKIRAEDPEYARWALDNYINRPHCLFPNITNDVKAAWAEHVEAERAAQKENSNG